MAVRDDAIFNVDFTGGNLTDASGNGYDLTPTGVPQDSIGVDEVGVDYDIKPKYASGMYDLALTGPYVGTLTNPEVRLFNRLTDATLKVGGNDWNTLASQVVGAGVWSGTLVGIPKGSDWLGVEVRKSNDTAITGQTALNFGVGHLTLLAG